MRNTHKVIAPEELIVGMRVAYPTRVNAGWRGDFRYPTWLDATVLRVTPKRTKVTLAITKDGKTAEAIVVNPQKDPVCEPDEDMKHENECVSNYIGCENILLKYNTHKWRALYSLTDDELKEAYIHLAALDEIMSKKS